MNIFDEARSVQKMMEMGGMTQDKLAGILGVSQSYIANKLRLLSFSDKAQKKIIEYKLTARHARCILRLNDEEMRLSAIEKAHAMKMNVARCEIMVDSMLADKSAREIKGENSAEKIGSFEKSLETSLSLLREYGISARAKREEYGEEIFFTIRIR